MRSRCELIYMFAYWFIADYIILRSVNFNYANRLNPLKYNLPIFYHRFTAIKTNTVKSIETMDWWEWATVKSAWIINGRQYMSLIPIPPGTLISCPFISPGLVKCQTSIGVRNWETYTLLSLRWQEYNDSLLLWLILNTAVGYKEKMNMRYSLLSVHHW